MGKGTTQKQKNTANNSIANNNGVTKVKRTRRTVGTDSPPQRSSIYRGVTRHRWSGRYEAHLWDKNCWNESQTKKGRQVYLGAYDDEKAAAQAYDLAALKYWGQDTILNFPRIERNGGSVQGGIHWIAQKFQAEIANKPSSGFSRGASKYRGVARHHHNGRWEARIGRVFGNKYLYLGTYATQEEAATAYDMAAIEYRGLNAITNFDLSRYIKWPKPYRNNGNSTFHSENHLDFPNPTGSTNSTPKPNHELGLTVLHSQQAHQPSRPTGEFASIQPRAANATSELGLLLESSKFKEMMEMTSATDCPSMPAELELPQGGFPDDITNYLEFRDSSNHGEVGNSIFGDLNSFLSPMFQCDVQF